MPGLGGRRVLVTGASSGIGAATARACAEAGAQVALVARRRGPLEELARDIGGLACPADVTDEHRARDAVERAATGLGGLDALVNNAGMMRLGPVSEGRVADWRAMLDVNVLGLLLTTHAALPHLRAAEHADIVNVSSMAGRRVPNRNAGVYAATKHAVHALTEGLRQELAGGGVRVTVVAPGLVDTALADGSDDDALISARARLSEIGLAPDDAAAEIAHVLTRPPHVSMREVAFSPSAQTS